MITGIGALGKCDSSSNFVCLDYSALSTSNIVSIEASRSTDSVHSPEFALGRSIPPSSYQADSSLTDVFYCINIEPSMNLKVTTFEFNSANVDQISVSLIRTFVPSLHNQVSAVYMLSVNTTAYNLLIHRNVLDNYYPRWKCKV